MTEDELERALAAARVKNGIWCCELVPALVAEVRRLRALLTSRANELWEEHLKLARRHDEMEARLAELVKRFRDDDATDLEDDDSDWR